MLACAALLIGFLTPIAAASVALMNLVAGISRVLAYGVDDKGLVVILLGVTSIALLLLGPGAYSLDAHLFGRRRIIIPEAPEPPL